MNELWAMFTENTPAVLTVGTAVVGALWAVWVFSRDRRIKTAEHLLALEKEYTTHLHTLLQIEYLPDYDRLYKNAVREMVVHPPEYLTNSESAAIDRLEVTLRYLALCSHMRRLRIDGGYLTKLHSWYLLVLANESARPDLRKYLHQYWPDVYYWSATAGKPWPKRVASYLRNAPERVGRWWQGQDDPSVRITGPNPLEHNRDADPDVGTGPDATSAPTQSAARVLQRGGEIAVEIQMTARTM
jgi:hypothetical protein